jgi:hypothetical protein
MRDTLQAATGRWWRFTKYVLSEGYVRPARGARLEAYDPWADYWRSRERGEVPPYQSLLDLLRAIKWNPSEGSDSRLIGPAAPELLEPEAVHQLLAWCAAHGLLGVLPQRALLLTLAPRFQRAGRVQGIGSGEQLRLVQQEFIRTSTEWIVNERKGIPIPVRSKADLRTMIGKTVPPDFEPTWNRPRVVLHDLAGNGLVEEPLTTTWARFFPSLSGPAERVLWPVPLSPEFWHLYAEPFEDFLWAMITFRTVLHDLADTGRRTKAVRRAAGRAGLHGLLASVSPVLMQSQERQWAQRWVSMSLLGSFAMMALLDLTEGWRLRECPMCRRPFVSDAWQARYCCVRCRLRAQKRAHRAKKRLLERDSSKERK